MYIKSLSIENFRNLKRVDLELHPRLNVFYGVNGAGKTSLLESLVVLSRGKSFKTAHVEELTGAETGAFRIFSVTVAADGQHRLGLERNKRSWKARHNGQDVAVLSVLTRHLPLVLMEPNSHLLVSGAPDGRRRFLDWGVFHVEHRFLETWRRYSRALKQRNAALRSRQLAVLDSLDDGLAKLGEALHQQRQAYFDKLVAEFSRHVHDWSSALQDIELSYQQGWKAPSLLEALDSSRKRDVERGVTSQGPHRGDLLLLRHGQHIRTLLSRGEQKALAAALLLTQARLLAATGEAPLVLLDDLASEFDQQHFAFVLDHALDCAGQVFVTGTGKPPLELPHTMFHVERGEVREMV